MHWRAVRGSIGQVTNETLDVVVVGAGAMGSAAAWALATAGRDVVVMEQHALGHDQGGSHGGSRLFRLDYADAETLASAVRAERLWRHIEAETGEDLLTVVGGLEHGMGSARLEHAKDVCDAAGVPIEILSAEEAGERWPQLAFEGTVVHQAGSGRLHPDRGLAALRRLASDRGAEFRAGTAVTGLRVVEPGDGQGPGLVEVTTADGTLRARHLVAAIGSWAPALLGDLVALPRITVTQEQPRFFTARDGARSRPGPSSCTGVTSQAHTAEPRDTAASNRVSVSRSACTTPVRWWTPTTGNHRTLSSSAPWSATCGAGSPAWTPTRRRRSAACTTPARTRRS